VLAVVVCSTGIAFLLTSIWWRMHSRREQPDRLPVPPTPPSTPSKPPTTEPGPFAGVPRVTQPVSPELRLVADRSQPEDTRLKPLVDGTVVLVKAPQDVALIRRILRDPAEGDTIRNEAANLLNRSEVPELVSDLQAVLEHPAEQARFRSFAAQHLGVLWRQGDGKDEKLRDALRSLLTDRHVEVRREALWPLAQEMDPFALAVAAQSMVDPAATGMHDLCCRIAALCRLTDLTPAIRRLAAEAEEVPRIAAILALAELGDAGSRPLVERAISDANPRIAAAAKRALAVLDGKKADE
jgi:HEAT repeat protein